MDSQVIGRDRLSPQANGLRSYFSNIERTIASIFDGLAVTSSWLFRRPITIQYPDRIERPIQETLPSTYRGILEIDLARCGACMQCARACPIGAIEIKVEKNKETNVREITRFDIDIGKCMYCGLCVEACRFDSLCHTTEFEATTDSPEGLVLHFVDAPVPVSKHKVGEGPARQPQGTILAQLPRRLVGSTRWQGCRPAPTAPSQAADGVSAKVPERRPSAQRPTSNTALEPSAVALFPEVDTPEAI